MIPAQVTVIPKFLMLKGVGLLNTIWALILPAIIDPLAIFLLRQNMLTIPKSYDESAYMDGAGRFPNLQKHYFPNVHALNRRSISHQGAGSME